MNISAYAPTPPAQRKVSILLGLGIFFAPYIFGWLLLRDGHTTRARAIGLGWLAFCILVIIRAPDRPATSAGSKTAVATVATVESAETSAPPSEPSVVIVSAHTLYEAYDSNEIAADRQYKGQRLDVEGVVKSIESDINDKPIINLSAGGMYGLGFVQVADLSADVAAGLNKGQHITVSCIGGGELLGFPMLKECALR